MKIRIAVKEDMENLFPLAERMATSFPVEYEAFKNGFRATLDSRDAVILVAETEGTPVGYLLGFDHFAFYANGRVVRYVPGELFEQFKDAVHSSQVVVLVEAVE